MKNNYIIRKAKPEDAEQYVLLENYVWRTTYGHIFPSLVFDEKDNKAKSKIQSWAEYMFNENRFGYVAELDNKIIGFLNGTYISEINKYNHDGYAELQGLYIHPDYQKIGIGQKFFDIFVNEISQKNIYKFVIGVLKDNTNARHAYEKWGGKLETYTLPYEKGGVTTEEVFYTYEII